MTEDSGKARMILGCILLILTAALACLLIFKPPTDEFVKAQLTIILGVFIAKLGDMFVFYFGTSAGAKTLSAAQAENAKAVVDIAKGTGNGNALIDAAPTGKKDGPVAVIEAPKEDTEFVKFRDFVRTMNPKATDDDIKAAWDGMKKPVDIAV